TRDTWRRSNPKATAPTCCSRITARFAPRPPRAKASAPPNWICSAQCWARAWPSNASSTSCRAIVAALIESHPCSSHRWTRRARFLPHLVHLAVVALAALIHGDFRQDHRHRVGKANLEVCFGLREIAAALEEAL